MRYNNDNLIELLDRAKAGSEREYHDLMAAVYSIMCKCACADNKIRRIVMATYESIEDGASDNIEYVMTNLFDKYRCDGGMQPISYIMTGYVGRVTGRYSNRMKRESRKHWKMFENTKHIELVPADEFEKRLEAEEREHKLFLTMKAIRTLPLNQQDALEGHIAGQTLRETAESMGVSHERVRQLKNDAVRAIRQILKKEV